MSLRLQPATPVPEETVQVARAAFPQGNVYLVLRDELGTVFADTDFAGLLTETIQHATRIAARTESAEQLLEIDVARLELPMLPDGVDLGSLYELAEALAQQGVR